MTPDPISAHDWPAVRFRYLADIRKGCLPPSGTDRPSGTERLPYLTMEYLRGESTEPTLLPLDPSLLVATNDSILLLWDGSNAGEFLKGKQGVVSSTSALVEPRSVNHAYFYWACKGQEHRIRAETVGMGIPHVNGELLANIQIRLPSLALQHKIADYLDHETERLDALIAAKKRVLVLLAEKRRALITRAVTRGLKPNVPLRESGIPWLGKIPSHWTAVALRFLVDLTSGATPNTGKSEYWDGEIPWVTPKDMKRNEITDSRDHVSELALSDTTMRLVESGSVLIVVRGMILAHSFPTAVNTKPVTINQDMKALRCCPRLTSHYLRDCFHGFEQHIVSLADSSAHGTRKLDSEVLGRLGVPLPPLWEQQQIVTHISEATSRLNALQSAIDRSIALLQERRTALIAGTVNGQVDPGSEI